MFLAALTPYLDLIFVPPHYIDSQVIDLAPIARSDHHSQLLKLNRPYSSGDAPIIRRLNYDQLCSVFDRVNWDMSFVHFASVDDYTVCLLFSNARQSNTAPGDTACQSI